MRKDRKFTAKEMCAEAAQLTKLMSRISIAATMLRYAADVVKRANERRGMYSVNYGRIDYEHDSAIVDEIDYILFGDVDKVASK